MEWRDLFNELNKKEYFQNLINFLNIEYNTKVIYPKKEDLFKCFKLTKFNDVKVIIIGQDPYHEENQANGLCFSVNMGVSLPPSLVNIYKEIKNEFGFINKSDGDLTYLARQGVLLLNKYLTVEKSKPLSHKIDLYDKLFVDIINFIETYNQNKIVYMLWGNEAKKVKQYVYNKNHIVLTCSHPSPLSANRFGWFNTNIFINCNEFLENNGIKEINWTN